jgi:hypothetical protein
MRKPSDIVIMCQGGSITYGPDQLGAVKNAILGYSSVMDTRAALLFSFIYNSGAVCDDIAHGTAAEVLTRFSDSLECGSVL